MPIDQNTILKELLSVENVSGYMAFAYNAPATAIPDDPSWVWPNLFYNPWLAMAVYNDMEEKDAMVASVSEVRKDNVLSKRRRVVPASDKRQDIKVANFIEETLESYFDAGDGTRVGLDHTLFEAMDAVCRGVAIGENIYENAPDRIFIKRVEFKPQHLFAFGGSNLAAYSSGSSLYPQTGPLRLRQGVMLENWDERPLPEGKFFVHSYRPRYSNRWGSPTDRKAFWASWFKRAAVKQWLRYLEKGPGSVIARYNDGAGEDEQNKALAAAQAVNEESAVALPTKFLLEAMQHVRTGMGSVHREMVDDFCNNEIARVYLGQTLTSRGSEGGGSRSLGEVHERVSDKKTEVDAKSLMMPVNTQLVWPLVLLNFGPNVRPPLWAIDYEPARDHSAMSVWLQRLWQMRLPISTKSIYNTFPVAAPEDEADTLPPPSEGDSADNPPRSGIDPTAFSEGQKKKGRIEREIEEQVGLEDGALRRASSLYDAVFEKIITALSEFDNLRGDYSRSFLNRFAADFDPLFEILGDGLLASYLLALHQASEFGGRFDEPVQMGFDVPPEEALKYFRAKQVVKSKTFRDLTGEARSAAFTVGGIYREDVLGAFKDEIAKSLADGTSQREVIKKFRGILDGAGHKELGAFHLETIFRTNMQMAYGVGRRRSLEDVAADLPLWQYNAVLDDRTRPAHAALDGLILPANHPFWDEHYPPWGFNCRCSVTATGSTPRGYDHSNPSGDAQLAFDKEGSPVKAEAGTAVYDLSAGKFKGVPKQAGLQETIEAGAKRARK
jgi:SPP1 gp7 family putative phage head morphogenesis protein